MLEKIVRLCEYREMFYLGKISALTAAICAMCAMHLSVAAEDVSPNSANNPTENAKKTTPEDFDGIAFLSDGNYKNSERTKTAIRSATGSLEAGMPALAQAIIEEFLSKSSPDENLREDLTAVYADALIAQGNFELAQKTDIPNKRGRWMMFGGNLAIVTNGIYFKTAKKWFNGNEDTVIHIHDRLENF
jgi:hypothetical protein